MFKNLGTYTVLNGLIYLNSLLRASILYAGETYYNITEKKLRMIEGMEENCLKQILDTGRKCPISVQYLETGHTPARFRLKRLKLNFLHYILQQKSDSLIFQFFKAQPKNDHLWWEN